MADYMLLFVPSNLEQTDLFLRICSHASDGMLRPCDLSPYGKGSDETYQMLGFKCQIFSNTVQIAQRDIFSVSKSFIKYYGVHSDKLYFLPLLADVAYDISIDPNRGEKRLVIRLEQRNGEFSWYCKIIASNLLQVQQATFTLEEKIKRKSIKK